jgi:hypothetical protein
MSSLSKKLAKLQALTSLTLNFKICEKLITIDKLGTALAKLPALTSLSLRFNGCTELISIGGLGNALGNLNALTSLRLNFNGCGKLAAWRPSVEELCGGLGRLQARHRDVPGEYLTTYEMPIALEVSLDSKEVGQLRRDTYIHILEVVEIPKAKCVRGRIEEGWISLADMDTGFRWAHKVHEEAIADFYLGFDMCSALPRNLRKQFTSIGAFQCAWQIVKEEDIAALGFSGGDARDLVRLGASATCVRQVLKQTRNDHVKTIQKVQAAALTSNGKRCCECAVQ